MEHGKRGNFCALRREKITVSYEIQFAGMHGRGMVTKVIDHIGIIHLLSY